HFQPTAGGRPASGGSPPSGGIRRKSRPTSRLGDVARSATGPTYSDGSCKELATSRLALEHYPCSPTLRRVHAALELFRKTARNRRDRSWPCPRLISLKPI